MARKKEFDVAHEKDLIRRAQMGDMRARKELHTLYAGLLTKITNKYQGIDIPYSAIQLHADSILDNCIDTYQDTGIAAPKTWFQSNMQEKIKRFIVQNKGDRYTSENLHFNVSRYQAARSELHSELGRIPTIGELTARINIYAPKPLTEHEVKLIHNNQRISLPSSTSMSSEDDSLTLGDLSFTSEDPAELYRADLKTQKAMQLINQLPDLHKKVLLHSINFPESGYQQLGTRNIALQYGITRYQVSKILEEAKQKLKELGEKELNNGGGMF